MNFQDTSHLCKYCFNVLEEGGMYCGSNLTPASKECKGCGLTGDNVGLIRYVSVTEGDLAKFKSINSMKSRFMDEWNEIVKKSA